MALNQKIFLDRSKTKHGDKYDYSKSVYTKLYDKVTITCPLHGDFNQTASDHMAGCGCQQCKCEKLKVFSSGNSYSKGKHKYTLETFIEKANSIHNNLYNYTDMNEFQSVLNDINIICPSHGKFAQRATDHLSGYGCVSCGLENISQTRKRFKLSEDFINDAKIKHNNKFIYDCVIINDNTKSTTKVEIMCPTHGSFKQSLRLHLKGHGCPRCSQECTRKTPKGENAKVKTFIYLLKLTNDIEHFYKIGITIRPINERISSIPYNIEILDVFETVALNAYKWEHILLKQHKPFRYHPTISFGGETECFSKLENYSIQNLLSNIHMENGALGGQELS